MKAELSRLEGQLERLVEGTFARLFASGVPAHELAVRLARAMEDSLAEGSDGRPLAPDQYTLRLHPSDAAKMLAVDAELSRRLEDELPVVARASGLALLRPPTVRILADAQVPPRGICVEAGHSQRAGETVGMTPVDPAPPQTPPASAYLIVNGGRHFPLGQPLVNIGRRPDNHLVLDHPGVSRRHAQLRLQAGRYVLYDLGSSSGTRVNNHAVHRQALAAGDVISLGKVPLIYVEEELQPAGPSGVTKPLSTLPSDLMG